MLDQGPPADWRDVGLALAWRPRFMLSSGLAIFGANLRACWKGKVVVAKVCQVCGKRPSTGHNVSNSYRHTKRRWLPNLQRVRTATSKGNKRMRVCTSCIKAGKIQKAG